jgi:receptor protein-tyrosine kinase
MLRRRLKHLVSREQATNGLSGSLVTLTSPDEVASENYRALRTNLFHTLIDAPPRVIVVTSPGPEEGKSTTCANLGVVLAQVDKKVLIMDCDLRKPAIHDIFGLRNTFGMIDIVVGRRSLQETQQEALPGLNIVSAGSAVPNPTELLESKRVTELLSRLRQEYDYVLLDAPPTRSVSDPVILSAQADGVLLVIDAQHTPKGSLRQAIHSLESVGARVLGTVMNHAQISNGNNRYGLHK